MNPFTIPRRFCFALLLFILTFPSIGQTYPGRDLFNFRFENDFNDNASGTYLASDFIRDWRQPSGSVVEGHVDIQEESDAAHLKYMRGYYPVGTYLPSNTHGFLWMTRLSNLPDELYFSFDVRFKPGFEWVLSGKLPGLTGGSIVTGVIPKTTDGFSARMIWQQNGQLALYVYHQDQPSIYGSVFIFPNFRAVSGKWYNLTLRLVLNTVSNGVPLKNGILEAFVDGKLMLQKSDLRFRSLESIKIDNMYICSFFGGNTPDFATLRDEWIDTDNYELFTYSSSLPGVPFGQQLSAPGRELVLPNRPISDGNWKKSIELLSVSLNSIGITWNDFPIPSNYTLERQEGGSGSFITVANLNYGTTEFTDVGLKTGITYTYRIKAGNSVSDPLSVTTRHPAYPNIPGNIVITDVTKYTCSFSWIDYSNNETGFKIERSLSATGPFQQIAVTDANITSYKDQPLLPGTIYYYRIRAYNQDGQSPYTPVVSATTVSLQLPTVPGGIIVSDLQYTSALIKWNDNSNNENNFELERICIDEIEEPRIFIIPTNSTTYRDVGLRMKCRYQYRIRAQNEDGYSAWSNSIEIVTPFINPPARPTNLKSIDFTDQSISVSWKDNSNNEEAFVLKRSLAEDSTNYVEITIQADDTVFTDTSLISGTTYQYRIKAVNIGGSSSESNKNIATTLSASELKRIKNNLIAYYNFGYNPDFIIFDQSGYGDPLNLYVNNRASVNWSSGNCLSLLSNSALQSAVPATKIVQAVKQSGEISVECWVKPSIPEPGVPSRIISLGTNDDHIGFLLEQNFQATPESEVLQYGVRMQTETTLLSGLPMYQSEHVQRYLSREHILYTRDASGNENLFINGEKSRTGFRPSSVRTWEDNYVLRLGNESDMQHLWKGSYYMVAFYDRALSEKEVLVNYHAGPSNSKVSDLTFQLEVFPNPAVEYVQITLTPETISDVVKPTSIRLIDNFGKVLYNRFIFNPNYQFNTSIDLKGLQPGIFLVQVVSGNRYISKKLIIK